MPDTNSDARVTLVAEGSEAFRKGLLVEGADITNPAVYAGVHAALLVTSKMLLGLENTDERVTPESADAFHNLLASAVTLAGIARNGPAQKD